MVWIRWLPNTFCLWYIYEIFIGFLIHLCWFYFRFIFAADCYSPVNICHLKIRNGGIEVVGVGDEKTTTMSMTSSWCLCSLHWTCFALPSAVHGFDFGHAGICGVLFAACKHICFPLFTVVLVLENLELYFDYFYEKNVTKKIVRKLSR